MNSKKLPTFTAAALLLSSSLLWGGEKIAKVHVSNASEEARYEEAITVPLQGLGVPQEAWETGVFEVYTNDVRYPSQTIDSDGDGRKDSILFLASMEGNETLDFTLLQKNTGSDVPVSAKRTQADLSIRVDGQWVEGKRAGDKERGDWQYMGGKWADVSSLKVPEKHSDHADYLRYEGIGIESDKVGYRIYLDWRNGFDIFGKTDPGMALKKTGLDGFESYHHMQDWGMDVLKVGPSLGIGGYGFWDREKVLRVSDWSGMKAKVLENGHLQSSIKISYKDWEFDGQKSDLDAVLSMQAGSRLVRVQLNTSEDVRDICTGLVKHEGTERLAGEIENITGEAWTYIATWGPQSLDGGNLGMAILFQKGDRAQITADELNEVVVLRSTDRNYEYYFLAAWDKEPEGITTKEDFEAYLQEEVNKLTIPSRTRESDRLGDKFKSYPMTSQDALGWSKKLADTQLKLLGDHLVLGGFDQDIGNHARWSYTTGLMCKAYIDLGTATGDDKYTDQGFKIIDSYINDEGEIATYNLESYNIDQINSGKMVLHMYEETGLEKFKLAANQLRQQLRDHPRTSEGGFWHKQRYPYQLWLDGVYMGMPFLAEWELMFNEGKGIKEAVHEFELVRKYCRNPKTGLYYHAWDEKAQQGWADPKTGLSKYFWGRGFGWYCMAVVDMLEIVPESQPELRQVLLDLVPEVADALLGAQDPESGVWWQILDAPDRAGNYLESSASSMFIYFLAKAINDGHLTGEKYLTATQSAFDGLIREFVEVDAKGNVRISKMCRVAGLGYGRDGSWHYYMSEPVVTDDPKGAGPFILAGMEVSKLLK